MKTAKIILFLGACVAFAARAQDPSIACASQIQADSRAQLLSSKLPFDPKGQSLEVLSNSSKPNAQEKAALSFMATEGERCLDLGADWRKANYPVEVNALIETSRVNMLSSMADLYSGKITFGEMAKLRAKGLSDLTNQVQMVVATIKAHTEAEQQRKHDAAEGRAWEESQARQQQEVSAQQQVDAARRQAMLQILMRSQQTSHISLPPPPIATNCITFGNSTNCTTR